MPDHRTLLKCYVKAIKSISTKSANILLFSRERNRKMAMGIMLSHKSTLRL